MHVQAEQSGRQDAAQVAVRERHHASVRGGALEFGDERIASCADTVRVLAARAPDLEQIELGVAFEDLRGGEPLVVAVVVLDQRIDHYVLMSGKREACRVERALQRTGEYQRFGSAEQFDDDRAYGASLLNAQFGEWQIGEARVLTRLGPLGCSMTNQQDERREWD